MNIDYLYLLRVIYKEEYNKKLLTIIPLGGIINSIEELGRNVYERCSSIYK